MPEKARNEGGKKAAAKNTAPKKTRARKTQTQKKKAAPKPTTPKKTAPKRTASKKEAPAVAGASKVADTTGSARSSLSASIDASRKSDAQGEERRASVELPASFSGLLSSEGDLQIVTFKLGAEEFAFPIMQVQEIIRMRTVDIVEIPNAPVFCSGVTNLRGRIVPVVDMAQRFGMQGVTEGRLNRLMVLNVAMLTFGIVVDEVVEVSKVPCDTIEPLPELAVGVDSNYIVGVVRVHDRMVVVLDLDLMFSTDEQSSIAGFGEAAEEVGAR